MNKNLSWPWSEASPVACQPWKVSSYCRQDSWWWAQSREEGNNLRKRGGEDHRLRLVIAGGVNQFEVEGSDLDSRTLKGAAISGVCRWTCRRAIMVEGGDCRWKRAITDGGEQSDVEGRNCRWRWLYVEGGNLRWRGAITGGGEC